MNRGICSALLVVLLSTAWVEVTEAWSRESFGQNFEKLENIWEAFKTRFAKKYENINDEETRRQVFLRKLSLIKAHNLEESLGMQSFSLGLNEFSDWSKEEYQKYLTGFRPNLADKVPTSDPDLHDIEPAEPAQVVEPETQDQIPAEDLEEALLLRALAARRRRWKRQTGSTLPDQVDWRSQGWVTSVKNQGKCGSCWSFTATGALEGQNFNKTGVLVSLSEQNLVDCSTSNYGCNGGVTDYAFRYVKQNGGIASEQSYPYTGKQGTCKYQVANNAGSCSGWTDIPPGDENALQRAVATVGPVAVAIDASSMLFQLYRRGVYKNPFCSSTNLDHAVLVVGYGTYKGDPYWLVKNSWGTGWGQDGYVMMARNNGNMCGIATQASYPRY